MRGDLLPYTPAHQGAPLSACRVYSTSASNAIGDRLHDPHSYSERQLFC